MNDVSINLRESRSPLDFSGQRRASLLNEPLLAHGEKERERERERERMRERERKRERMRERARARDRERLRRDPLLVASTMFIARNLTPG